MSTFLLLAVAFLTEPKRVQVTALDGQSAVGTLVELNDQQVVIEPAVIEPGGPVRREFKFAEVRLISPVVEKGAANSRGGSGAMAPRPTVWLETIDGSRIPGAG